MSERKYDLDVTFVLNEIIKKIEEKPFHLYCHGKKLSKQVLKKVVQPLHLFRDNYPRKHELKNYVCSIKPDGIFTILVIDSNGICYYSYPKKRRIYRIGVSTMRNISCSGELMTEGKFDEKIKPIIILFDVFNDNKILNERVELCKKIVKSITLDDCFLSKIIVKNYYPLKKINRVISSKIKIDGIIFTPKRNDLGVQTFRWKPCPTITVGFDFCFRKKMYYMFLWDKKKKKKVFCSHTSRHFKCYKKSNATILNDIISESSFIEKLKKYKEVSSCKNYTDDFLAELYMEHDYFLNKNEYSKCLKMKRFRLDKNYPDDISIGIDLFDLMENPVSLNTLLRKKSIYSQTVGMKTKMSQEWSSFVIKTKEKLYEFFSKKGKLLDLGSGKGVDFSSYYKLSTKIPIDMITLVDNDEMQYDALLDKTQRILKSKTYPVLESKTHYMRKDNIGNRDCIIKTLKVDINDNKLPEILVDKFDTVILSNTIQFAFNSSGLKNIKKVMNKNGILILIFMDGNNFIKYKDILKENPYINLEDYNFYVDTSSNLFYDNKTDEEPYEETNKDKKSTCGIFWSYHDKASIDRKNGINEPTFVEIKLPWSSSTTVEPIIHFDVLKYQLYNMGFNLVDHGNLSNFYDKKMKQHIKNIDFFYKYAIFNYTSYKTFNSIFKCWGKGVFYVISFLTPYEIDQFSYTCKSLRQFCHNYLEKNKFEKDRYLQYDNQDSSDLYYDEYNWT